MHRLTAILSIGIAACGGSQGEPERVEETPLVATPSPDVSSTQSETRSGAQVGALPSMPGKIRRTDLLQVIAKGPGAVLAMVETEPFRQDGRFIGFKIIRYIGGPPAAVDLREGDVLRAVNGLAIVTPDDYFRVFQELQVASEIRFDILRKGAPLTLTYAVTE